MWIADRFRTLSPNQREGIPYLILVMTVFAVYANVYHNIFVLDDLWIIVGNTSLRHGSDFLGVITGLTAGGAGKANEFHRPLQMLLYFFIYQLFGLSPPVFHFLNVVLQAANACLVYRLGGLLGLRPRAAFSAALLWGVHPLHTEVVTYMTGTAELLYSFFCLLGLIVLLPDFAPRKFWLAGLLFVLGLCSKESAVVFPALVTITIFLVSRDRLRPAAYIRTWPLWLLAAVYLGALLTILQASGLHMHDQDASYLQYYGHNLANRILTCLATLPVYLGLMVWPAGLHMDRSFPVFTVFWSPQVLAGAALVALVILQILWGQGRRGLAFSWGALWFAVAFSPSSGILIPVDALISEHWLYLPSAGLFLGVVQTAAVWLDRKPAKARIIAAALVALAAMALGAKTYVQNEVWRDSGTLYQNIFRCGETSGRAHNNLGVFYLEQGESEKAAEQFRIAIADPTPLPRDMIPALHTNLAMAYLRIMPHESDTTVQDALRGLRRVLPFATRIPEAIEELDKSLELNPDDYWTNIMLAEIYAHEGDNGKAHYYDEQAAMIARRREAP